LEKYGDVDYSIEKRTLDNSLYDWWVKPPTELKYKMILIKKCVFIPQENGSNCLHSKEMVFISFPLSFNSSSNSTIFRILL
jgi:hypothetical protein